MIAPFRLYRYEICQQSNRYSDKPIIMKDEDHLDMGQTFLTMESVKELFEQTLGGSDHRTLFSTHGVLCVSSPSTTITMSDIRVY